MRVINDKEEKSAPSELGLFTVVAYSLFTALGIATVALSPLPFVLSHLRLEEPWPKIASLAGAVVALLLFEVPASLAVGAFVFGMFFADRVLRGVPFWKLLTQGIFFSALLGVLGSVALATSNHAALPVYWASVVDSAVEQLRNAIPADKQQFQWNAIRDTFFYEGPFLYIAGFMLSIWCSVGAASHFGWFPENHPLSAQRLRTLRLPKWLSMGFVVVFFALFFEANPRMDHFIGGFFRLISCLMFIQGCVCLSEILERRKIGANSKTIIYFVAVLLGFSALMGMGVMSPWLFKKNEKLEETL